MILIPEGGGMRLESHATVQTPGTTLSRLDSELSNILHGKNFENDDKKWLAYQEILERYLQKKGLYQTIAPETPKRLEQMKIDKEVAEKEKQREEENFDVSVLLHGVKKTYRSQCKQLAEFIKRSSNIGWTSSGRVVIDGVEMPDSNVVDLLNDAARYRKTSAVPHGRAQLASALRRAGVPRKLIGNQQFWDDADISAINLSAQNIASSSPKDTSKVQASPSSSDSSSTYASPSLTNKNSNNNNTNKDSNTIRAIWHSWRPS